MSLGTRRLTAIRKSAVRLLKLSFFLAVLSDYVDSNPNVVMRWPGRHLRHWLGVGSVFWSVFKRRKSFEFAIQSILSKLVLQGCLSAAQHDKIGWERQNWVGHMQHCRYFTNFEIFWPSHFRDHSNGYYNELNTRSGENDTCLEKLWIKPCLFWGWTQPMNPTYEPHLWTPEICPVAPMNVTEFVVPMNVATYERQKR